jgi:hypothetical protein
MIVALDDIPRAADPCDPALDWRPVRDHLGIRAFGVNAFLGHREAFATAPDTAVLVVGAQPGKPFSPSAWEQRQLAAARDESR